MSEEPIEISDAVWHIPCPPPLCGYSRLVRTHDGMGIKREWVPGLLDIRFDIAKPETHARITGIAELEKDHA